MGVSNYVSFQGLNPKVCRVGPCFCLEEARTGPFVLVHPKGWTVSIWQLYWHHLHEIKDIFIY